jgi:hypothetical protein
VSAAWHALLAPLPEDARPEVKPVLSPELAARPESAAVAGWRTLSLHLSAGPEGLRHVMVTLDAGGRALSAGDSVVYRKPEGSQVRWRHESLGGRLEEDGTFRGTRWRSVSIGPLDSDETQTLEQERFEPSADEAARLKALAAELIRRSGSEGFVPGL